MGERPRCQEDGCSIKDMKQGKKGGGGGEGAVESGTEWLFHNHAKTRRQTVASDVDGVVTTDGSGGGSEGVGSTEHDAGVARIGISHKSYCDHVDSMR